ncbi:MAG: hypothetical protein JXR70_16035 [Spirochaetales bacterium]|nr:hypothetical protein [Spirochaetales bacterium]
MNINTLAQPSEMSIYEFLNSKILQISRIVLLIAFFGYTTYSFGELFWGQFPTFIIGIITSAALLIPFVVTFLQKVKLAFALFILTMTLSMICTQYFYLDHPELMGLMMVDFTVYFGLVISSGFIFIESKNHFIAVLGAATINGLIITLISTIPWVTKRFFLIELFIMLAIGFMVYYFTDLYSTLLHKADDETKKQQRANKELTEANRAFSRFVPTQFLDLLNKTKLTDIQLGDQIQQNMTVMFSDIRSFTSLSEKMSPKENFDFLNSLLKLFGPAIRHYEGFIDKYIGDAVLSIFPNSPDDALKAAVEIQKMLMLFNESRILKGEPAIGIGMGINTGDVMVGIIGEDERMEETVISDAVNLASRLESMTKNYKASILISGETLENLKEKSLYQYRFLDQIQVAGRILPVSIYEVFYEDKDPEQRLKYIHREHYEEGWNLFCEGRINEAINQFKEILKVNPKDGASKYLLNKCYDYVD